MDVGASAIAETPVYKTLIEKGLGHLNAFEGDQRQINGIKNAYGTNATIFNDFLFDGSQQTLYVASAPSGMTSLLKPKTAALNFFNGFDSFGTVEKTETIQTKTLDSIQDLPSIDFLKMDIQGAELTVLKNGLHKLKDCIALQLEVSYICLYENQPTFGEVDVWLRAQGFVPHSFLDVKRWSIAPTVFNNNFRIPGNQLLESDIVYVKDPLNLQALSNKQLKIFATLSHFCFRSPDLCVFIFIELVKRGEIPQRAPEIYFEELNRNNPFA